MCVCVCVCVCVCMRTCVMVRASWVNENVTRHENNIKAIERNRDRERGRDEETERRTDKQRERFFNAISTSRSRRGSGVGGWGWVGGRSEGKMSQEIQTASTSIKQELKGLALCESKGSDNSPFSPKGVPQCPYYSVRVSYLVL